MRDRIPGAPGQYKASVTAEEFLKLQAGKSFSITLIRDDQPITEGTPYNKASVLPDELAAIICPDIEDPTLADALRQLSTDKANTAYVDDAVEGLVPDTRTVNSKPLSEDISLDADAVGAAPVDHTHKDQVIDASGVSGAFSVGGNLSSTGRHYINNDLLAYFKDDNGVYQDPYGFYLNPPFSFGTEYMVTERWLSSAVYKKWMNIGNLAAAGGTVSVPHGITNPGWIIGCRGVAAIMGSAALEMVNGGSNGSVFIEGDNITWYSGIDLSAYAGFVELTYCKN